MFIASSDSSPGTHATARCRSGGDVLLLSWSGDVLRRTSAAALICDTSRAPTPAAPAVSAALASPAAAGAPGGLRTGLHIKAPRRIPAAIVRRDSAAAPQVPSPRRHASDAAPAAAPESPAAVPVGGALEGVGSAAFDRVLGLLALVLGGASRRALPARWDTSLRSTAS
jgi:hypothetical protein